MAPRLAGKPAAKPAAKKKASSVHKLPETICEGEILRDIQKRQWRIGKSIGVGGFGEIYAASDVIDKPVNSEARYVVKIEPHSNGPLFVEMNFYIRVAKADMIDEWKKSRKLKFMGMPQFIGSGSHLYKGEKYRFMVMERFGTDVQKLFEANNKSFPLNTVLNLGLRIIDVLEYIHDKQYVHADIKGSNLLLGFGKGKENEVWLVDFGLACRYSNDGVHKEYKPDVRKAHNGTIEFTSRDAHIGANGRRGDFEILGYNLLQWLCSRLPWEDKLTDTDYVAAQKNRYMSDIPSLMKQCFQKTSPPAVMKRFMEMVAKLKFEEKPDYDKFRTLLKQGLKEGGYKDDGSLVFSTVKNNNAAPAPKKKSVPSVALNQEPENVDKKKRSKTAAKSSREPCTVKVTNRGSRQTNETEESSSDTSAAAVVPPPKQTKKSTNNLDTSLNNPTPAMLAILARMRNKQDTSPVAPSKKKHARLDSESNSSVESEPPSQLTPAMQDVIRVRDVRKSMEQSRFFTPVCSPMDQSSELSNFPSSTPHDALLQHHLTLDCSSDEEQSPVRKTSARVLRDRKTLQIDTTNSTLNSSAAADISMTPDGVQRRVIHKRKYKVVSMASASTQTTPGVLKLPSAQRDAYSLRSGQNSSRRGTPRGTPPVVDLSPDIFRT